MPDDDDDRFLITPLEGPPDPNVPHVTVDCARGGCRMSFFVAKSDPRLPDGPFLCPDHGDVPLSTKMADLIEVTLYCDRCEAQLRVDAPTREEARAKMRALAAEKHWRFVDRLDTLDAAVDLTGSVASTTVTAPDLCGDCASQR